MKNLSKIESEIEAVKNELYYIINDVFEAEKLIDNSQLLDIAQRKLKTYFILVEEMKRLKS